MCSALRTPQHKATLQKLTSGKMDCDRHASSAAEGYRFKTLADHHDEEQRSACDP
jgi:hypothetical protein